MAEFHLKKIARMLRKNTLSDILITGFQQDSRLVLPGNMFFALKGERTDGHAFLSDVVIRGAKAAVVSKQYRGDDFGLVLLRVDDVLCSLQSLARDVQA